MNSKTLISIVSSTLVSLFVVSGIAYAASINATSKLGGSSGDDFEFDGTGRFNSVYIGKQGSGGVTFFNGTIINSTTNNGVDNPVTFGDDVRIDGKIHRGANAGPASTLGEGIDTKPVVIDDDFQVNGVTTFVGDISWGTKTSYLTISGDAFHPTTPSTMTGYQYVGGSLDRNNDVASAGTYETAIQFPHGVKITDFEIRANDTDASSKVEYKLYRLKSDYTSELLATVGTTDVYSGGNTTVNTSTDITVDNQNNSYYVTVVPGHQTNKIYNTVFTFTFSAPY